MEEKTFSKTFEDDLNMMKYFQEEFIYRHKHFWEILIKLFALTVGVTILPLTTQIFGVQFSFNVMAFSFCFPGLGLLLSGLNLYILIAEAKRMDAVNRAKYRISNKMDPKYQYNPLVNNSGNTLERDGDSKKRMAFQLPIIVFIIEFLIIVCVVLVLIFVPQSVPAG